jgi:hypothetical protein
VKTTTKILLVVVGVGSLYYAYKAGWFSKLNSNNNGTGAYDDPYNYEVAYQGAGYYTNVPSYGATGSNPTVYIKTVQDYNNMEIVG